MPPFLPYEEDQNKKKLNDPQNISGQSTSFNNQPPGANQNVKAQKSSGQYTNINSYLNANKDQSTQMGSEIAQETQEKATKAQSDLGELKKQVVEPTVLDPNQYLNDPTSITHDDYSKLKNTGGYEGPDDLSKVKNIDSASKNIKNASDRVNALASEEGVGAILQEKYKRPDYSKGQQTLDNVLVRNNEANTEQFNNLQNKYSNLNAYLNNTTNEIGDSINKAVNQAQVNKEKFVPAETEAWNNLVNPINQRVSQYNANKDKTIDDIYSDFNDDKLKQQTLSELGLNINDLGNIYDLDLSKYIQADRTQANLDNIANQQERERYSALRALIGDESRNQINSDGAVLDPAKFNLDAFKVDLADRQSKVNDTSKAYMNTMISGFNRENMNAEQSLKILLEQLPYTQGPQEVKDTLKDYYTNLLKFTQKGFNPDKDFSTDFVNTLNKMKNISTYPGYQDAQNALNGMIQLVNAYKPNRTLGKE